MNRGEAIDKIMKIMALAERPGYEGEGANAQAQIERIKEQFNLTDREIERALSIERAGGVDHTGPFGGGSKIWYYERRIKPHVDQIRDEITAALEKIGTQDLLNQVNLLSELFNDLRAMVDKDAKDAWLGKVNVQRSRNEVIARAYREEYEKIPADRHAYMGDRAKVGRHEAAMQNVKYMTGYRSPLTTAMIEAIVGVHSDDYLWEQMEQMALDQAKEQGCTCQPRFTGKRKKTRIPEGVRWDPGLPLRHQRDCPWTPTKD